MKTENSSTIFGTNGWIDLAVGRGAGEEYGTSNYGYDVKEPSLFLGCFTDKVMSMGQDNELGRYVSAVRLLYMERDDILL